ncbi:hypothetical protein HanXRQr2_Chr16g0745581 [Helianthus annuus]|uniref:Uncharacterized protein n=1 Tax=Helianthus annuus TaxID=4232 RepID=A0A9K3GXZ4_HELAN|nr:hypothetical protein HanXRQr2_Chr16g0745581 [Helianthus annuus]KAJ0820999.1 hypothetical protein HanPSC8_Chr16g0714791 [Helianthus annuus]
MSKRLNAEIHCSSTKPTDAETSHFCRLDNANTNTEERRQFKERRKLLKLQLDNRRSNMLRNITNSNNISSSNSTTSLTNDLQNTPSSTPFTAEQIVQDPYKGVSKYYLDHGDQLVVCEVCNAKLWESEAGKGMDLSGKTSYMLCCGY